MEPIRFTDNKNEDLPPLLLVNGDIPDEPYEGSPGSGNDGHAAHAQVRNAKVSGDRFENCVKCVVWGRDSSPFKPDYVRFVDNEIITDKVQSVAIKLVNAEPFHDGEDKELFNEFASNTVVGNASIDSRVAQGFRKN